jgi:hypothetical protein
MSYRVYYAHCIALYGTPQEDRDVEHLETLGFEVLNPNNPDVSRDVAELKAAGREDYMDYFHDLIQSCDAVAFRSLPDGRIPAGVAKEVQWADEVGIPVIELTSNFRSRVMSVEATRDYLKEIGQR